MTMRIRIEVTTLFLLMTTLARATSGQQPAANPHGSLPDGLSCASCHTAEAWTPLRADLAFDHGRTGFPLDGRHRDVSCTTCHLDLNFGDATADVDDCASCHLDVHQGTPTRTCSACHTTESFNEFPLGIVHPADFPLEGAHLQITCESCHTDDLGGAFAPPDRECASCHMGDYAASQLVDHQSLGFSTDCTECHSSLDFRDVAFDHFTISGGFELIGQHAGIECTSCHSPPDGGIPEMPSGSEDCVACHLDDYEGEHRGSGFPTDCLACHTANTWDGADFDHLLTTGFALIPNHDQLECFACHVGSTSQTLWSPSGPQDCYACHMTDYEREHSGTGFPTDCTDCHQLTTWSGATFDHSFPIFSGPHAQGQAWNDCSECHTVPGDFQLFSCFACHGQTQMDAEHREVSGYTYDSPSCLSCHPNGRS